MGGLEKQDGGGLENRVGGQINRWGGVKNKGAQKNRAGGV